MPELAQLLIPPEYDRLSGPLRLDDLHPTMLELGTVMVFPVRNADGDCLELAAALPKLRRRFPAAPFALLCRAVPRSDTMPIAAFAATEGIRVVLDRAVPRPGFVRRQLANPRVVPHSAMLWLVGTENVPDGVCAHTIGKIFSAARRWTTFQRIAREQDLSVDRIGRAFRNAGIKGPGHFASLARRTYEALYLQYNTKNIKTVAQELGYAKASSLSDGMCSAFGIRASQARHIAGFEPLLWLHFSRPQRD